VVWFGQVECEDDAEWVKWWQRLRQLHRRDNWQTLAGIVSKLLSQQWMRGILGGPCACTPFGGEKMY